MMRKILCVALLIFGVAQVIYAEEVTILFSGQTHAMLYTCSCPSETDGGVARRATLVKQLRGQYPDALLLDSGSFFAGGLLDEYTQNTQLDMQRTLVNIKAMEIMQYDAAVIGDDEFNFGADFFSDTFKKSSVPVLSANIEGVTAAPYLIKEVQAVKIGIIGVTDSLAAQKAQGIKILDPVKTVSVAVAALKKAGADIIMVVSHAGESSDASVLNAVSGIDILIQGGQTSKKALDEKLGSTIVVRPSWQGRKLGKLSLFIEDKKIASYKAEDIRLSDKLSDDPEVLKVRPACFANTDCKKQGFLASCQNPGSTGAQCVFTQAQKINLTVITSRDCIVCDTQGFINFLKRDFPGIAVSYLYYPDAKARKLIASLGSDGLPVYLFGKEVQTAAAYAKLESYLEKKGEYFLVKPEFSGISYFLNQKRIKGAFDIFVSLYDSATAQLLKTAKVFNPTVHFLTVERDGKFDAKNGAVEVEDHLRAVCLQKQHPELFWPYMSCRSMNPQTSWWQNCAPGVDAEAVRACATGPEGEALLRENIALTQKLKVMFGPAYLMDNQEIFASKEAPTEAEFKKILKR